MSGEVDRTKEILRSVARPLLLEREGAYGDAMKAYQDAIGLLNMLVEKSRKRGMHRLNRKLYQRQAQVHRDRLAYLQTLSRKESFGNIVPLPTVVGSMSSLARERENDSPWTISQVSS